MHSIVYKRLREIVRIYIRSNELSVFTELQKPLGEYIYVKKQDYKIVNFIKKVNAEAIVRSNRKNKIIILQGEGEDSEVDENWVNTEDLNNV